LIAIGATLTHRSQNISAPEQKKNEVVLFPADSTEFSALPTACAKKPLGMSSASSVEKPLSSQKRKNGRQ